MRVRVKVLFFIYIIFYATFSFGDNVSKNHFSNENIVNIKRGIIENKLELKNGGSFIDFKTYRPTKDFLTRKMKEEGSGYIFPSKEFYLFFLRYLDDVIAKKDIALLMNKSVEYKSTDGVIYVFFMDDNNLTIRINVFSPVDIDGFPYSESSYMYSFDRDGDAIMLSKINVAG